MSLNMAVRLLADRRAPAHARRAFERLLAPPP
jgi:hypothetical protein